jgi:hypothetical protein
VIEEGDPDRDLAALRVPQTGRLVATGNRYEPYQVVDPDGVVMDGAAQFFRDLLAAVVQVLLGGPGGLGPGDADRGP